MDLEKPNGGHNVRFRRIQGVLVFASLPAVVAVAMVEDRQQRATTLSDEDLESLRLRAMNLSLEEVTSYEVRLKGNPDDVELRCLLASYYAHDQVGDFFTRPPKSQSHMLWIIRNYPGTPRAGEFKGWDQEAYAKARDLWLESTERFREDPSVLGNAGLFLSGCDLERAIPLLAEAQRLDPTNPKWSLALGRSYTTKYGVSTHTGGPPSDRVGHERAEFAARALAAYELALRNSDEKSRRHVLKQVVLSALRAGELEKAERYARGLIAADPPTELDRQNAGCLGHTVIGHAALERGDLDAAEAHLLQIAATAHPQQLSMAGPMNLADALLKHGRREAVVKYLKLCQQASKYSKFGEWITQIESGATPKFNTGDWY